ncbi:hypothetical protein MPER_05374 [Moniliophthora perniciosa FA553]|nr:hypothetical protein MPER_05374 [Moniliophthora perniciosa FA553]
MKDGLGPDREGRVPPHSAGVDLPSNTSNGHTNGATVSNGTKTTPSAWTTKGPPHKHRYCTLLPPSPSAPATSITPLSAHPSPSEILRVLQDELFPSQAFRAWLAIVTRLLPLRFAVEARRFRPGLDYTLATSEEKEARLDVVLGLTPEIKAPEVAVESSSGRRRAVREKPPLRGWSAAEWGGWECYMAPHNEEDDPAVYRSGTYKKSDVVANGKPKHVENGYTNGSMPNGKHASNGGVPSSGKSKSPSPTHSEDADGDVEIPDAEEDEEDDSTLLTPGFNRLLLVLRDERVMRFVNVSAEGSRWDVCAEYEVGMMQEDEGEEEASES